MSHSFSKNRLQGQSIFRLIANLRDLDGVLNLPIHSLIPSPLLSTVVLLHWLWVCYPPRSSPSHPHGPPSPYPSCPLSQPGPHLFSRVTRIRPRVLVSVSFSTFFLRPFSSQPVSTFQGDILLVPLQAQVMLQSQTQNQYLLLPHDVNQACNIDSSLSSIFLAYLS